LKVWVFLFIYLRLLRISKEKANQIHKLSRWKSDIIIKAQQIKIPMRFCIRRLWLCRSSSTSHLANVMLVSSLSLSLYLSKVRFFFYVNFFLFTETGNAVISVPNLSQMYYCCFWIRPRIFDYTEMLSVLIQLIRTNRTDVAVDRRKHNFEFELWQLLRHPNNKRSGLRPLVDSVRYLRSNSKLDTPTSVGKRFILYVNTYEYMSTH